MAFDRQTMREAREAAGLTREALAAAAGLSLRTVERIEAGDVKPHRATMVVLAHALDIRPEELEAAA